MHTVLVNVQFVSLLFKTIKFLNLATASGSLRKIFKRFGTRGVFEAIWRM